MAVDFEKEIRRAVDTGKVEFGYRTAEKNALLGKGLLLVLSEGLGTEKREKLKHTAELSGIPVYEFDKTALKLGSVCGKPFPVTAMTVTEQGKSKVLTVAQSEQK